LFSENSQQIHSQVKPKLSGRDDDSELLIRAAAIFLSCTRRRLELFLIHKLYCERDAHQQSLHARHLETGETAAGCLFIRARPAHSSLINSAREVLCAAVL
jgi:hypothetical protein